MSDVQTPGGGRRTDPDGARRPNVVFITVDQWRGECLGARHHPVVQTPNLDALAARGTMFTRHYSQASPCGPSRASIWTGQYLHNHRSGFNGTPLDDRFTNIARQLRPLGYNPTLFGYTDTTLDPRTLAADDQRRTSYEEVLPGFSVGVNLADDHLPWLAWMAEKGYQIDDHEAFIAPIDNYPGADERGATWPPPPFPAECTETAFLTEAALDHLAGVASNPAGGTEAASGNNGAPWFVHMSYLRPHPPFVVPEPYNDLYDPTDVPMPIRHETAEVQADLHPLLAAAMAAFSDHDLADERHVRQLRATYYGMMTEVDAQVGRLLDAVAQRPDADNTVVILTSDHGEMLGDHWQTSKLGFYPQSFHIPLIIAGPGIAAGRVIDSYSENVDLAPTIQELVGGDPCAQYNGRSLVPLLRPEDGDDASGGATAVRDSAHWSFDFRVFASMVPNANGGVGLALEDCHLDVLLDGAGMYVHIAGLDPLFFDLEVDPDGLHNFAADPARASQVLDYAQRMLSWRQRTADQTMANLLATPKGTTTLRTRVSD